MVEQLTEQRPIVLSVNCIVGGKFIRAGDPTPYEREEDLPEDMKAFIATGDDTPFDPSAIFTPTCRGTRAGKFGGLRQSSPSGKSPKQHSMSRCLRAPPRCLRPSTLNMSAARRRSLEHNQAVIAAAYEGAAQREEEARVQHYVRRGAVYKRCDATRLRPGEQYFAKRAGGWEYVGVINARGELPEQEIQL